ncbi:glutaredoxin-like protein [Hepatocystis sp. ex Piliocolobus tephrosceles]|nr:glutaredoxin-like protein [Hepatocystis sp. ex Piliocolobus tephrosceles]
MNKWTKSNFIYLYGCANIYTIHKNHYNCTDFNNHSYNIKTNLKLFKNVGKQYENKHRSQNGSTIILIAKTCTTNKVISDSKKKFNNILKENIFEKKSILNKFQKINNEKEKSIIYEKNHKYISTYNKNIKFSDFNTKAYTFLLNKLFKTFYETKIIVSCEEASNNIKLSNGITSSAGERRDQNIYHNGSSNVNSDINSDINNDINKDKESCSKDENEPPVVELNEDMIKLIESILKKQKLVLFMKGTALNPFCKYSKQAIYILKLNNVKIIHTVNILENEDLKKALKIYSNWPTFPQLYVNGKFIGGIDKIQELHDNNELKNILAQL